MPETDYIAGIEYPSPFDEYAVKIAQGARRHVCILSPELDHAAFDQPELVSALSDLARSGRQAGIRILIKDVRRIVARGHRLLNLARRMPSKVEIQLLPEHPEWQGQTLVLGDRNGLLFNRAGSENGAFFEPDSPAEARQHLEQFNDLWRHSAKHVDLRALTI